MTSKKNPQADLNNKSSFYFAIGLFLVLFISWRAIEYKNWDDDGYGYIALDVDADDDEEIPITEQIKTPPPPPPPPAPEIIEVVEDEEEIEETIIESTETDQEEIVEEVEEDDEIFNFAVVENKPVFPGCEKRATEDEKFMCFNQNIMTHIGKNFDFPELARQMGIQGKVYVNFVIEKNGKVSNVTIARGVDKLIDDEAIRVIKLLPKFTPAKQRGKPVRMQYTVPINARLQ